MNFLRGQDDFFQTANQPISVRHLSQPYNKDVYYQKILTKYNCSNYTIFFSTFKNAYMSDFNAPFSAKSIQFELSRLEINQKALYFRLL